MASERFQNAFGVGISSTPFPGFAPNRIDGADALGLRLDEIEIVENALLVGNGHAESGDGQSSCELHPIGELGRRNKERKIDGVQTPRMKGAVVNQRRLRMRHGARDYAIDAGVASELLRPIERVHVSRRNLSRSGAPAAQWGGIGVEA